MISATHEYHRIIANHYLLVTLSNGLHPSNYVRKLVLSKADYELRIVDENYNDLNFKVWPVFEYTNQLS